MMTEADQGILIPTIFLALTSFFYAIACCTVHVAHKAPEVQFRIVVLAKDVLLHNLGSSR